MRVMPKNNLQVTSHQSLATKKGTAFAIPFFIF